jgi:hypothetical protein
MAAGAVITPFLQGMIAMACLVVSLFFLRWLAKHGRPTVFHFCRRVSPDVRQASCIGGDWRQQSASRLCVHDSLHRLPFDLSCHL